MNAAIERNGFVEKIRFSESYSAFSIIHAVNVKNFKHFVALYHSSFAVSPHIRITIKTQLGFILF
jgi:hypothetical protein